MSVKNQDAFRRPWAVVAPNFQIYAIRRSVNSSIYSLKGWEMTEILINDLFNIKLLTFGEHQKKTLLNWSSFGNATNLNLNEFIDSYSQLEYNQILCRYIAISQLQTALTLVAKMACFRHYIWADRQIKIKKKVHFYWSNRPIRQ